MAYLLEEYARDAGAIATERRAVIVMGYPGAGKSTFIKAVARDWKAAVLDADKAKALVPGYDNGLGSQAVHAESAELRSRAQALFVEAGANIVLETVGDNAQMLLARIASLEADGYTVSVVNIAVSADEAVRRQMARFVEEGRYIAPAYMRAILNGPPATADVLAANGRLGYLEIDADGPRGTARIARTAGESADLERALSASLRPQAPGMGTAAGVPDAGERAASDGGGQGGVGEDPSARASDDEPLASADYDPIREALQDEPDMTLPGRFGPQPAARAVELAQANVLKAEQMAQAFDILGRCAAKNGFGSARAARAAARQAEMIGGLTIGAAGGGVFAGGVMPTLYNEFSQEGRLNEAERGFAIYQSFQGFLQCGGRAVVGGCRPGCRPRPPGRCKWRASWRPRPRSSPAGARSAHRSALARTGGTPRCAAARAGRCRSPAAIAPTWGREHDLLPPTCMPCAAIRRVHGLPTLFVRIVAPTGSHRSSAA